MAVRPNRYWVPGRLIGKWVRVVLHASHLVVYDRNVEAGGPARASDREGRLPPGSGSLPGSSDS
ncbi:hypothetical protein [Streptomyces sp. NPDC054866]